jgi:hypothetical protein
LASSTDETFTLLAAGVNSDGTGKRVEHIAAQRKDALKLAMEAGHRIVAQITLR